MVAKLVVVTPVGPGHQQYVPSCRKSVTTAWQKRELPRCVLVHEIVEDFEGTLGRGRARNEGIMRHPDADWYFFLDCDDVMAPKAFMFLDGVLRIARGVHAFFGAVHYGGTITSDNKWPCSWEDILELGAQGTLSMGALFSGPETRAIQFAESLTAGEDFEFYLQFLAGNRFTKIRTPLVHIKAGQDRPSAGGPLGYASIDWQKICKAHTEIWRKRGRTPMSAQEREDTLSSLRASGLLMEA